MDDLSTTLVNIFCAETLDQVAALGLRALVRLLDPAAACLLVWDADLARYIVGETFIDTGVDGRATPAELRRLALRLGREAWQTDPTCARPLNDGAFYLPFNVSGMHLGALLAWDCRRDVPPQMASAGTPLNHVLRTVARALSMEGRLQEADREHAELAAERERLEGLLNAVEKQQRTIDELLAVERQFSASLEAKVEERTAALRAAQGQLIQSEKLAVIGQLASSLAHELNNPLQAMQSGLGLVIDELEEADLLHARDDLRIIQEELERIESIFRQMLDFYRPASGDYVPLDLNAICEGVRVLMRKRLQETHVALELELNRPLPLTCGDSNQIKQVLINLLLNAAEAMHETGGTVTLATAHHARHVMVSVADDGPGIAPEHQARLFEPLFTTKARGLGMGLAISQEIAQRHGGHLAVDSTPGAGTIFTLHLPVREHCHDRD